MNKTSILITVIVILLSCIPYQVLAQRIADTKWQLDNDYDCSSYLSFQTDSITIYDCETGEKIFGTYKIDADTIRVQTISGEFDTDFPPDSRHRHEPFSFKLLRQEEKLIDLKYELTYSKTK
jgi:hypothetical protein